MTIIHRTKGLIDPQAFTVMGLSAKPNSTNPIGQFGTGLKYAIATLVRLGAQPQIWIGRDRYTFRQKKGMFRGDAYMGIEMELQKFTLIRPKRTLLPITTNYGKFWKPWMAFRELQSNTLDEGGETAQVGEFNPEYWVDGDHTLIVVDSPEYEEAWEKRDEVFLPGGLSVRGTGSSIQVMEGEGKHLYYRSLRVYDLEKPSLYTYNFLEGMELTEDRTLKWTYMAKYYLARQLLQSDDEGMIEAVLTADDDYWEHGLEFDKSTAPSPAFMRVMARRPRGISSTAYAYWGYHDPTVKVTPKDEMARRPLPWSISGDDICDALGNPVLSRPSNYEGDWEALAKAVLKAGVLGEIDEDPVEAPPSPAYTAPGDDEVPF